ncbi:Protein FAR1-RELATED SEQUENCE [Forsythia ovata]|uniref:Protein FAR1-RELATED SEQUENCE n=1 Tax=Forsythia ovata TaxID=205694 RepID=A0ABD1NVC6_9LAMI
MLALFFRFLPLVHIPQFTTRLAKGPLTQSPLLLRRKKFSLGRSGRVLLTAAENKMMPNFSTGLSPPRQTSYILVSNSAKRSVDSISIIRVQRAYPGKWVLDNIRKENNHELKDIEENCTPRIQRKSIPTARSSAGGIGRTRIRSNGNDGLTGVVDVKRLKMEELDGVGALAGEPYKGLEFNHANEA